MAKKIDTLRHDDRRVNIPTAEVEPLVPQADRSAVRVAYERRNRDLDPQLVWRGKDEQDLSDLLVNAPPVYIQEKIHPKALIDDLHRRSKEKRAEAADAEAPDLFADFNGMPEGADRTDFYAHDQNWSNRMILGDSLQVMASLAEREGLRGKVQCIYIDPPYGIRFNSNFQWSTTTRDVKDGKADHISREPEQVKAFRDTWRDGIHSYLAYLRDRLTVARDLLTDSGSIFVQIGDENVHRVRALMDEVFGEDNFCNQIQFKKTGGLTSGFLPSVGNYLLWYAKDSSQAKFRQIYNEKKFGKDTDYGHIRIENFSIRRLTRSEAEGSTSIPAGGKVLQTTSLESQNPTFDFCFGKKIYKQRWKTNLRGLNRLARAGRLFEATSKLRYIRYVEDFPVMPVINNWDDTGSSGFRDANIFVVQTVSKVVERCILMTTDPGDLVLDPTSGSGTTAYATEQWGRRWIVIDTSRIALALSRGRLMGARYPWYLLADSAEGRQKEAELTQRPIPSAPAHRNLRQGFVCERVPHITLKSIANNAEIDVIWERWQETLEPLREALNAALGEAWEEWQIPRDAGEDWSDEAKDLHRRWWEGRIARQREIDASIEANADVELLYDKPYVDPSRVRVAGPFTVESLSPVRALAVDEDDELIDPAANGWGHRRQPAAGLAESRETGPGYRWEGPAPSAADFTTVVLDNLKAAGVQQAQKQDRIRFTAITPWPGESICAEGRYVEGPSPGSDGETGTERRAGIFIGPEFGTVARADLVDAAREAADAGFDVVIACAFNFEAHAADFDKLGRLPVLRARINADLHMGELKETATANLFVVFGEPDIEIRDAGDDRLEVEIKGVDVFKPQSGEVVAGGPDDIAVWFLDTDYDEESFFVRQAYFPGTTHDPYKALKTTLKAEIDEDAWATVNSTVSRPFPRPESGRIAVKVINHLGDEVMKVFRV